jgi:predicted nucleotidyltransferase component of viral defense system
MRSNSTNLVQSIHQKLLNIRRESDEDFQFLLIRYSLERFLYRLSKSAYASQFILKGAFLFAVWTDERYRPTKDLDLLGFGESSPSKLKAVFREICNTVVDPDGLIFNTESIAISEIREEQDYEGQRIKLISSLGKAKIPLQIDIAFGDAVTPQVEEHNFPSLLKMPSPRIRTYPKETVVAEKLQSMIRLGMQNSRMKDFFDLFWLSRLFIFEGSILLEAIQSTFQRRKTSIPTELPLALKDEFSTDNAKQTQWKAFLKKNEIAGMSEDFADIITKLRDFLAPPLKAASSGNSFPLFWSPGGVWQPKK